MVNDTTQIGLVRDLMEIMIQVTNFRLPDPCIIRLQACLRYSSLVYFYIDPTLKD
jgi:hypothetical protein